MKKLPFIEDDDKKRQAEECRRKNLQVAMLSRWLRYEVDKETIGSRVLIMNRILVG